MPLTAPVVVAAYRMILGRDPGSRTTIDDALARFDTLEGLRQHLLLGQEFLSLQAELVDRSRNPGLDLAAEKLVFMHIPKTAGTSLTGILDRQFRPGQIFPDQLRLRAYPAVHLGRFQLFRGHFPLRDITYIPGATFVFTLLRQPRARILSQYHFHRARRADAGPAGRLVAKAQLPLKQYLADPEVRANPSVDNAQTRFLFRLDRAAARALGLRDPDGADFRFDAERAGVLALAQRNLAALGGFGLAEQFDDAVALLCAARGWAAPAAVERRMVTAELAARALAAPAIAAPDAETEALLDDLVALDEALYGHAATLFAERQRSLPAPASGPAPPAPRVSAG